MNNTEKDKIINNESFSIKKLASKGFGLFDLVQWSKWLNNTFKTLLVTVIILSVFFGFGYWKGKSGKPIWVNMEDFHAKVKCKYSDHIHDISVINYEMYFDDKKITEGDIPKLKPYGIELKPKLFAGVGLDGTSIGFGSEVAHFYKFNLDIFAMSDRAIYTGISYDLNLKNEKIDWFSNSSLGIGMGKSTKQPLDNRVIFYWTIKF